MQLFDYAGKWVIWHFCRDN